MKIIRCHWTWLFILNINYREKNIKDQRRLNLSLSWKRISSFTGSSWIQLIESRYNLICDIGEKSEPPPKKVPGKKGRYTRTKGRNLVERLTREKDAILAFAFNKEVPFTNNLAARYIRPAKVKQKIQIASVLSKGLKSMPELKDSFQMPEKTTVIFSLNYAPPLKDIISLQDKYPALKLRHFNLICNVIRWSFQIPDTVIFF